MGSRCAEGLFQRLFQGFRVKCSESNLHTTTPQIRRLLRIDGRNLFLMQSQDYGRDAPYVIVDKQGKELTADRKGFTEGTIEQIRKSLKELESRQAASVIDAPDKKPKLEIWQQYFENGEYLRAAEISEEQNYNMIDGTANNRVSKRSIIERLQEKQSLYQFMSPHWSRISNEKNDKTYLNRYARMVLFPAAAPFVFLTTAART